MGLAHWMQNKEVKKDQKTINNMDDSSIEALRSIIKEESASMSVLGVNIDEILESDSYNIVDNQHWGNWAIIISSQVRVPLVMDQSEYGKMRYLAVSIILDSVRAVIQYEQFNKKEMLIRCQQIWDRIAQGDKEQIPKRFK